MEINMEDNENTIYMVVVGVVSFIGGMVIRSLSKGWSFAWSKKIATPATPVKAKDTF